MEKRSFSVALPAAVIYFVLLGCTDGQSYPGKVFDLCYFCSCISKQRLNIRTDSLNGFADKLHISHYLRVSLTLAHVTF